LSLALASNELVLAYNDDGTSALTQPAPGTLRLIGPKKAVRFDVSAADCKAHVQALQKALVALRFTGVEASIKGCGKPERATIVRTLKRHADAAREAELPAERYAKGVLEIDGLPAISLGAKVARVALSPTKKLVLMLAVGDGGATIVRAVSIAGTSVSDVALE
jgi:hypothetical protein